MFKFSPIFLIYSYFTQPMYTFMTLLFLRFIFISYLFAVAFKLYMITCSPLLGEDYK